MTPVGLSAPATCAALRAGVARMLAFEGWIDGGPPPSVDVMAGRVPLEWLSGGPEAEWPGHERWNLKPPRPHLQIAPGPERLRELAIPAAAEAWAAAGAPRGRIGLYLGLAEDDEATPIADALAQALEVDFELVRRDRLGRAAGLAAVHRAVRHLRDGRIDVALCGAVDSNLRRAPLERAAAAGTLRIDDSALGIIPGEAAAFAVLEPAGGPRALAHVLGSGVAEEQTAGTEEPNQGVGLTDALRRARAGVRGLEARPLIVCDLNGERYRTLEWGLASIRALGDLHAEPGGPASGDLWHPADCIGDPGAGSGMLSLVWAVTALHRGYARSQRALLWGASDGPLRAAVVLGVEED
jgi:3-oxoacyl-[acyl-carrier-protein] synthase-1